MTYSLTNKCAKNYNNRALIVQVIAENVVTCFFLRHSVYIYIYISVLLMLLLLFTVSHVTYFDAVTLLRPRLSTLDLVSSPFLWYFTVLKEAVEIQP